MRVSRWVSVGIVLLGVYGCSDQQATETGGDPDATTPPPVAPTVHLLPPAPKALYLATDKGNLYSAVLVNDQHPSPAMETKQHGSTAKLSVNLPPPPKEAGSEVGGVGSRIAPGIYRAEQPLVARVQRSLLGELQLEALTAYGEWLLVRNGSAGGSMEMAMTPYVPSATAAGAGEIVWWAPGTSLNDMVTVWHPRSAQMPHFDAAGDQLVFVGQQAGEWQLVRRGLNGVETAVSLQPLVATLPGSPHIVLEDFRAGVALLSVNSHLWYAVTVADGAVQSLDELCAHARLFASPDAEVWVAGQSCGGKLLLQLTSGVHRITLAAPPASAESESSPGFKLPTSSYDLGGFLPSGEFAFRHTVVESAPAAPSDAVAASVPANPVPRRHTMLKVLDPVVGDTPTVVVDYDVPLTSGAPAGTRVVSRWRDVVGRVGARFLVRGVECRLPGAPTDFHYTPAGYTIDMPCAALSLGDGGTAIAWQYAFVEPDGTLVPLARYEWPTRLAAFWPESDLLLLEVQRDTPSLVAIRLSTGKELSTLPRSAVWTTASTIDDEPRNGSGGRIEATDQQSRWPGLLVQMETSIPGDYEIGVVGPEQIDERGIGLTKLATVRGAVRRVAMASWKPSARTDVVMADAAAATALAYAAPGTTSATDETMPAKIAVPATPGAEFEGADVPPVAGESVPASTASGTAGVDNAASAAPAAAGDATAPSDAATPGSAPVAGTGTDATPDTPAASEPAAAPSEPQPATPPAAAEPPSSPPPYSVANLLAQYSSATNSVLTIPGVQLNSVAPIQNIGLKCMPQKPSGFFEGQLAPGKTTSVTFTIKVPIVSTPRDCTLIASDATNHWTDVQSFHIDLALP